MSARMSARRASTICSGAMKSGVPSIWPSYVSVPSVGSSLITLASPKSSTLITARFPLAGQHQVARLDIAVDHAVFVRVLKPQGRLVHVVAGVHHGQRARWP